MAEAALLGVARPARAQARAMALATEASVAGNWAIKL